MAFFVIAVLDKDKNVKAAYDYSPYGVQIAHSGDLDQPYRYSTKHFDNETGMIYFGYRFYLPKEGRWLNRDPLSEMGGLNLYQYVGGDPVSFVDPFGLYYSPEREHGISRQEAMSTRPGIDVPERVKDFIDGASDFYRNYGDNTPDRFKQQSKRIH